MNSTPTPRLDAAKTTWKPSLILFLVALAVLMQRTNANIVSDMIGSWISEQTALANGVSVSGIGSSKSVRYGVKGLYTTATVTVAGVTVTSIGWMHDSGTLLGFVKQGQKTIGVLDGTWKVSGNKLIGTANVRTLEGDYTQTVVTEKLRNGRLQSTSSTSTGLSIIGTAKR